MSASGIGSIGLTASFAGFDRSAFKDRQKSMESLEDILERILSFGKLDVKESEQVQKLSEKLKSGQKPDYEEMKSLLTEVVSPLAKIDARAEECESHISSVISNVFAEEIEIDKLSAYSALEVSPAMSDLRAKYSRSVGLKK